MSHRAFTIVEVLVAIAVIMVLVAIVSSALVQGKRSAGRTVEISNLRSLGQAAALYAETFEAWPVSATTLVDSGRVPKVIAQSPLDRSQHGFTNSLIAFHAGSSASLELRIPPYPVSFVGLGDLGYQPSYFEKNIRIQPGAGWLVSLLESSPEVDGTYGRFDGRYRRLMLDTSVQTRQHIEFGKDRSDHPAFWFSDGDDRWKEEIIHH